MKSAISDALTFLRTNDIKTILSRIRERRVPGLIQFAVYAMCGGLATVFFLGFVVLLSKTLFPAYEGMRVTTDPTLVLGIHVSAFGHGTGFDMMAWPANSSPDHSQLIASDAIGNKIRAANLLINNIIGFLIANVVAYITNILFVFKGGRHHPALEFVYFTLISGIAFVISQAAGPWLVNRFGIPTNLAILSNVLTSMLLNFVCRKFFVFKS
jgi:putative flippase GtrA